MKVDFSVDHMFHVMIVTQRETQAWHTVDRTPHVVIVPQRELQVTVDLSVDRKHNGNHRWKLTSGLIIHITSLLFHNGNHRLGTLMIVTSHVIKAPQRKSHVEHTADRTHNGNHKWKLTSVLIVHKTEITGESWPQCWSCISRRDCFTMGITGWTHCWSSYLTSLRPHNRDHRLDTLLIVHFASRLKYNGNYKCILSSVLIIHTTSWISYNGNHKRILTPVSNIYLTQQTSCVRDHSLSWGLGRASCLFLLERQPWETNRAASVFGVPKWVVSEQINYLPAHTV